MKFLGKVLVSLVSLALIQYQILYIRSAQRAAARFSVATRRPVALDVRIRRRPGPFLI
jgi:hypothetical protein